MRQINFMNKSKKELIENIKRLEYNEEIYKETIEQQYKNASRLLKETEGKNKANQNLFTIEMLEDEIRGLKKMYLRREPYHGGVNDRFERMINLIKEIK